MVTTELAKSLQQALEAHRKHLNKHLKIWKNVQLQHAQDPGIASAAESCEQRTVQMLEQCSTVNFLKLAEDTGTTGSKKNKRSKDVEDLSKAKKARKESQGADNPAEQSVSSKGQHFPVTKDPSGLFMIDSNPAKFDVSEEPSEKQTKQKKNHKRGRESDTEEDHVNAPPEVESSEEEQSTPKRKKARKSDPVQNPVDEEEEYAESLSQKVVLRLKEKDEISKQKANKKRKRESDASIEEKAQTDVGPSTKPPPTKKRKGKAATAAETAQFDLPKSEKGKGPRKKKAAKVDHANGPAQPKTKKKDKSAA